MRKIITNDVAASNLAHVQHGDPLLWAKTLVVLSSLVRGERPSGASLLRNGVWVFPIMVLGRELAQIIAWKEDDPQPGETTIHVYQKASTPFRW